MMHVYNMKFLPKFSKFSVALKTVGSYTFKANPLYHFEFFRKANWYCTW